VLKVVHDKEDISLLECGYHGVMHDSATGRLNVDRLGDRGCHQTGIANRIEWDEADSVSEGVDQIDGELDCEARFADPAWSGERQKAEFRPEEQFPCQRKLALASDKRRQWRGQVGRLDRTRGQTGTITRTGVFIVLGGEGQGHLADRSSLGDSLCLPL
jgi:hypothetical protein